MDQDGERFVRKLKGFHIVYLDQLDGWRYRSEPTYIKVIHHYLCNIHTNIKRTTFRDELPWTEIFWLVLFYTILPMPTSLYREFLIKHFVNFVYLWIIINIIIIIFFSLLSYQLCLTSNFYKKSIYSNLHCIHLWVMWHLDSFEYF